MNELWKARPGAAVAVSCLRVCKLVKPAMSRGTPGDRHERQALASALIKVDALIIRGADLTSAKPLSWRTEEIWNDGVRLLEHEHETWNAPTPQEERNVCKTTIQLELKMSE